MRRSSQEDDILKATHYIRTATAADAPEIARLRLMWEGAHDFYRKRGWSNSEFLFQDQPE